MECQIGRVDQLAMQQAEQAELAEIPRYDRRHSLHPDQRTLIDERARNCEEQLATDTRVSRIEFLKNKQRAKTRSKTLELERKIAYSAQNSVGSQVLRAAFGSFPAVAAAGPEGAKTPDNVKLHFLDQANAIRKNDRKAQS